VSERLRDGLIKCAAAEGFSLRVTGPATMPTVTFAGDPKFELMSAFAEEMVERGSFVHPSHNWFLSAAHTHADIDRTLSHAAESLNNLARRRVPARAAAG
jgi:glutamate-1-semialdehyde 2,1-aminomutase